MPGIPSQQRKEKNLNRTVQKRETSVSGQKENLGIDAFRERAQKKSLLLGRQLTLFGRERKRGRKKSQVIPKSINSFCYSGKPSEWGCLLFCRWIVVLRRRCQQRMRPLAALRGNKWFSLFSSLFSSRRRSTMRARKGIGWLTSKRSARMEVLERKLVVVDPRLTNNVIFGLTCLLYLQIRQ